MLELTCDGETGGTRPDDNRIAAVLDLCHRGSIPRFWSANSAHKLHDPIVTVPTSDTMWNRGWFNLGRVQRIPCLRALFQAARSASLVPGGD